MMARRSGPACWIGRNHVAFSCAGRCAPAAASGCGSRPDCLGYGDGVSAKRHAGAWRDDVRKARRRIKRRKTPDQAELRCFGRNSIGWHARRDCGRPGSGWRRVRRRAGSRGCDLCPALAAVSGDVDCGCKALADLARPFLAAALQNKGQRLLYLTPWPPSGIWSKSPLKMPSDLTDLSIRTYDKTSSEVFASAGAKAASISFADTMPKLAEGSINAVLSSGDGGTGRKLWEFLPYFSEITYSLPLSVASVNQAIYDGLTPDLREAVDTASHQTEIELWLALSTRLQENYQRMRQNGVTIDSSPAPAVVAVLQSGAAAAQQAWCTRSGSTCAKVLEAFKTGKP